MLLAAGMLFELGQLVRILLWIVLPVFILSGIITGIHHFRRKKNKNGEEPDLLNSDPAGFREENAYLFFDHTGLLRQYRNKLGYNHARYNALKQDFEQLELKYRASAVNNGNDFILSNNKNMENSTEQWQQTLHEITTGFEREKQELLSRLDEVGRSCKHLGSENEILLEQISMAAATNEERELFFNKWREENRLLKERITDQACLTDMLEAKKVQVEFLQSQLELRIRSFRQAEQDKLDLADRLSQSEGQSQQQAARLAESENKWMALQEEMQAKQMQLTRAEEELASQTGHLHSLQSNLAEIREQNELLHAELNEQRSRNELLLEQREEEKRKLVRTEEILEANKQVLRRFYTDIASCMEEDRNPSQVVAMRPVCIHTDIREDAAIS